MDSYAHLFEVGDCVNNFTVTSVEEVPEVNGVAYVMRHEPSGARLLYLANGDVDKAFTIGFKTPPVNNTGVFHIIEHTVLCGSEKYPVKEPFVELLQGSMHTFLNAITYDDKTIYPISSTSEQELLNMMDVYMDAVLHPLVCQKETIFRQEGWHYELAEGPNGPQLSYNGIVYNEMKGALSSPESKLENALEAALFPDTAYGYVSGGVPGCIPQLDYGEFVDTYRRHYRLDNSYIFLYGDLEPRPFLSLLDEEYLTPGSSLSAGYGAPNPLLFQSPVDAMGGTLELETSSANLSVVLGYVASNAQDRERTLAVDLLIRSLCQDNSAPLKKLLLNAGLSSDVRVNLNDGVLQPYVKVTFRKLKKGAGAKAQRVLEDAVRKLIHEGLDENLIEAALSNREFSLREDSCGMGRGINLVRTAMAGWFYDDSMPVSYLRFEDELRDLRSKLGTGYFSQLLKELFLENPHRASVELVPAEREESDTSLMDAALLQRQAALTPDEVERIATEETELRRFQEAADSPETLALIPHLSPKDVGPGPEECPYTVREAGEDAPFRVLRHQAETRKIVYATQYYDASQVAFHDLPYLAILAEVLGEVDTTERSISELNTLVKSRLGCLSFNVRTFQSAVDPADVKIFLVSHCSCLSDKVSDAAAISKEVMTQSRLDDKEAIRKLLTQRLVGIRQGFANGSTGIATRRASSYFTPIGVVEEALQGVDYFRFLRRLLANFDDEFESMAAKLHQLAEIVFCDANCTLSFIGSDEDLERFSSAVSLHAASMASGGGRLLIPTPCKRNEAFLTDSDVSYSALSYDSRLIGSPFSGAWLPAEKALSYGLLWNEVRVKGGAYGGGFSASPTGKLQFSSWRDPHVDRTFDIFEQAADWLRRLPVPAKTREGYVLSAVAELDAPVRPSRLASNQTKEYFEGITLQDKRRWRQQALETTAEALQSLGSTLDDVISNGAICTTASRQALAKTSMDFQIIDILNEED